MSSSPNNRAAHAAAPRGDRTPAWAELSAWVQAPGAGRGFDLKGAFARNPQRFEQFSLQAPGVFADLSKNLWDGPVRERLLSLAQACGVTDKRDAMMAGEVANPTEGRAVLHTALRAPRGQGPHAHEVHTVLTDCWPTRKRCVMCKAAACAMWSTLALEAATWGPRWWWRPCKPSLTHSCAFTL